MDSGFSEFFYSSKDGLALHARLCGAAHGNRLPVVCLPGLTRNARDFDALARMLADDEKAPRQVIAFDYRGRGKSDRDPDWRNYRVDVEAEDIAMGLTVMGIERAAFIGTSRGGLITMALAATHPALIEAAVLNDIGPRIEGAGLAHIRGYLENAPSPASLAEAVRVQKAANGPAFTALSEEDWERHTAALYRQEKNRLVPDHDPKLLKALQRIDLSRPLPESWQQFEALTRVPVLALRGANSTLLSAETLEEMARIHPQLEAATVEGQGHPPLLETGDLPRRILAFLARAER